MGCDWLIDDRSIRNNSPAHASCRASLVTIRVPDWMVGNPEVIPFFTFFPADEQIFGKSETNRLKQVSPFFNGTKYGFSSYPLTFDRRISHDLVEYQGEGMPTSTDLLQGTLDLLILQTLSLEPMHGWGVAQRIQLVSNDALQIGQGSLYPAIYRLEYMGWIKADWGNSENNRRAKFYRLTAAGRRQLDSELETWDRLSAAIGLVLGRTVEVPR